MGPRKNHEYGAFPKIAHKGMNYLEGQPTWIDHEIGLQKREVFALAIFVSNRVGGIKQAVEEADALLNYMENHPA